VLNLYFVRRGKKKRRVGKIEGKKAREVKIARWERKFITP
jgi:hypothetical protein